MLKPEVIQKGILAMLQARNTGNSNAVGYYIQNFGYTPVSSAFADELVNSSEDLYHIAHEALAAEDLTQGWKPSKPIYFYHATNDDCVPVQCSYAARDAFKSCPSVTFVEDPAEAAPQLHSAKYATFLVNVLSQGWR